jgi:DNA polymerase-1
MHSGSYDEEGVIGFENAHRVAVDVEASGLFADDGARLSCVACAWEDGVIGFPFDQGIRDKLVTLQGALFTETEDDPNLDEDVWRWMLRELEHKELVFHNGGYDLTMLLQGTRHWDGVDLSKMVTWDTMVCHRVLYPTRRAGLDAVARQFGLEGKVGLDEVGAWLKKAKHPKTRYDLAPWRIIRPYVEKDAELTLKIHEYQIEEDPDREDLPTTDEWLDHELALMQVLFQMETRGIAYDSAASLKAAEELEEKVRELEASMPFPCDITGAKKYFFQEAGLSPDRVSKNGNPSLDEEQVRDWATRGVQWASEYKQAKWAKRAISMWYRGYPEKMGQDGRLRCRYKHGSVTSGRLAVERVQLQAMPKADKIEEGVPEVRKLLLAKEGHQLWSLDMSQAELRVAAKYARCQTMLDALLTGADFHGQTNERVLKSKPEDPDWKLKRDIAKRLTFGSIFQIGGQKFQATLAKLADIHWPLEDCERAVRTWRNTYPEFGVAYRKAERVFGDRGWVRILPDTEYETRSYKGERPGEWPHTGWNRMVQGSLAAWLRMWLPIVEKEWPGLLVLTVHDSVVLEIPEAEGEKVAKEVAERSSDIASDLFDLSMPVDYERYV